jgi:hypothetical protein
VTSTFSVVAASGLSKTWFRCPKPFVTITAENNTSSFRTRTANKTTSPTWEQVFQLYASDGFIEILGLSITYRTAVQESTIVKFQVLHQSSLAVRNRPLGSFEDSIGHLIALRQAKDGEEPLSRMPSFVTKPLILTMQRLAPSWLNLVIRQTVTTAHHQHFR